MARNYQMTVFIYFNYGVTFHFIIINQILSCCKIAKFETKTKVNTIKKI